MNIAQFKKSILPAARALVDDPNDVEQVKTKAACLIDGQTLTDDSGAEVDIQSIDLKLTGAPEEEPVEETPAEDEMPKNFTAIVEKAVNDAVTKTAAAFAKSKPNRGLILDPPSKAFKIPAEVKRTNVKYFRKGKVGEFDECERAYRFGMWAMAAMGHDNAKAYCEQHGIIQKLQQESVNTTGGYLVPEEFGTDIIDLKEQYGVARRLFDKETMTSDTKTVPRRTGGLTAYFVSEGGAGTESTTAWDQVRLTAKDLMVLTRMTNQLDADSIINWSDKLAYEISYANTLKEDQCAFLGDGSTTYGGITGVNQALKDKWSTGGVPGTGVGLIKQGSSTTWAAMVLSDFDAVVGALPQYADTPNACWVCHRVFYYGTIEKLVQASGGVPAYEVREGNRKPRPLFKGYPVEFAQVMPATTASAQVSALLGDFTLGATFGDRQQDSIAFSDQATVGGQSMWERNEMGVRGTSRFDIVVHDVGDGTAVAGPIVGLING